MPVGLQRRVLYSSQRGTRGSSLSYSRLRGPGVGPRLPATLQAAGRDPSGGFLFPTRKGCSGLGPAWPPSRGPAPATEAARPRPPQLLGISGRGIQSWAATRTCGVFSGPLLVWAPVQSDKELSVSPSSPAPPPRVCQDSRPLRGPASPDTSKAFPPRGWGVP